MCRRWGARFTTAVTGTGQSKRESRQWATMAKRPTRQKTHSWAIYHIAARQKLVGIVRDQPDADSAIKAAIVEYDAPVQ
jgi:hypothetical protein